MKTTTSSLSIVMRQAAALPLILAIVIFTRCDSSFEPDVDESLSEEVRDKRINTVKTWYFSEISAKQNGIPVLPDGAVSKTVSDSTIASVLTAMVSKYPPNWDMAETWSNGHGGYYMATILGFNESTTSPSDSRISVIRTFVADVDSDGNILTGQLVEFVSLGLQVSLFKDYVKQWLVGDFGEIHILVAEYSLDYASTQAFFHQPDKKPKAIAMKLIVKSEMGKVLGTTSCWVSDDYSIEMCSPTPVGMPESGECVETRTIEVTCVVSHDGGGGCTICGGSGGGGGGSGNGGGGGGCTSCRDNGDSNDLPKPGDQDEGNKEQLRLVCDESIQRGSSGGCKITSENESIQVKSYTFTWSSSFGASNNTYGWVGTATETVKITVKASTGWTKTAEIKVTDRDWPGPSEKLNTIPMYTSEPRVRATTTVGLYRLVTETELDKSISQGSGPWAGRFYIGYAPSIKGELHVAKDFDFDPNRRSSLPEYSLSGTLCPPVIQSGVSSASYWYVNSKCGSLSAAKGFALEIIRHEEEHAAGYQQCLDSHTTEQLFEDLEKVTGTRADVAFHSSNNQGMWRVFLRKLLASGRWASGVNYSKAFYQYHLEWVYALPSGGGHSGSNTPC